MLCFRVTRLSQLSNIMIFIYCAIHGVLSDETKSSAVTISPSDVVSFFVIYYSTKG